MESVLGLKGLRRSVEHHGKAWYAMKHKCQCEPCRKAAATYRREMATKYRRKNGVKPFQSFRHGTRYAWERKRCECLVCLDSKVKFLNERKAQRAAGGTGVLCSTNGTQATEEDRNTSLASA